MDMMMNHIMSWEIIPNWHPIFVHFTVGLLSVSALLYLAGLVFKREHFLIVGRWNLWLGALITVGTVIAGLDAYYSVKHDALSHAAMTDHRNWALVTASLFVLLALWALWKHRGAKTVSPVFVGAIMLASGLLAVTGYKGGEVVYRHGMGVMRMPEVHGDGGHGSHAHDEKAEGGHHSGAKAPQVPEPDYHKNEGIEDSTKNQEDHHDHGSHDH